MQANVRFQYWVETDDEQDTVELTVRAAIDPGTDPVTDRRPELCDPGEGRSLVDIQVLDECERIVTRADVDARFGDGTWSHIVAEALSSRLEPDDSYISRDPPERDDL